MEEGIRRMEQFVCIKDNFGNDRWFLDENLRIPPMPDTRSLEERLNCLRNLELRPDDVIIVGYVRSGNNWLHQMIHMLLEGALDTPPWFGSDSHANPETATADRRVPPPTKPRALYTHLLFKDLPPAVVDKKVKVVHISRNLKDAFVSLYCFTEKLSAIYRYHPPWPEFLATMLDDGYWYGNAFDHVTSWEKAIDDHPEHPFHTVTYEDLKQDGAGQLEKIDKFLETNRGKDFCQSVVEKCHINNMEKLRMAQDSVIKSSILFRKGVVGDWKNWFTVAQNEEFEEIVRKKMAGCKSLRLYEVE